MTRRACQRCGRLTALQELGLLWLLRGEWGTGRRGDAATRGEEGMSISESFAVSPRRVLSPRLSPSSLQESTYGLDSGPPGVRQSR